MPREFFKLSLALILAACLVGCTSLQCSPENCSTDAKITSDVQALFDQRTEFGPPGTIRVKTVNGTVYLNGKVNTDLLRRSADALVNQVPNVKAVVNSIYASNAPY